MSLPSHSGLYPIICCIQYVCTLLPPQKCGNLTCGSFSGCINCLFVIEEGRLVQKSTTDCLHVCSNITVIIQSDASSGPTLQSPDTCVILIIGDSCQASVRYRVFQNDKLLTEVHIAADAGSEYIEMTAVLGGTYVCVLI